MDAGVHAQFTTLKARIEEIERKIPHNSEMRPLIAQLRNEIMDAILTQRDVYQSLYNDLREQVRELELQFQMVMGAPKGYGTFIRNTGRFDEIESEHGGAKKQVPVIQIIDGRGFSGEARLCDESVKPEELIRGQKLLLFDASGLTHAIKVLDEFETLGREAHVAEILPDDHVGRRVILSFGDVGLDSAAYWMSGKLDGAALDIGSRVLADPVSHLVVHVLPEREASRYLVGETSKVTFADIGGLDAIIATINESLTWPILYADKYATMRSDPPRGFVLTGPPGCGKTMIGKAVVNEMARMIEQITGQKTEGRFFYIGGPELLNMYVGNTEAGLRRVFADAKKIASPTLPALIFFDEADALFPVRGSGISSDVNNTIVPQFNALMDGLVERGNVIVLLATNREDLLDPAVIRPGRIDKIIRILRPDAQAAKSIFAKYLLPEWGMIHPKYNQEPYMPIDRDGQPKSKEKWQHFQHNPMRVVEYLIDRAVMRMFDQHIIDNEFVVYDVQTGPGPGGRTTRKLRYCDFVSGADIAQIVETAKRLAIKDSVLHPVAPMGIEMTHLYQAIEARFNELRGPQTLEAAMHWLVTHGRGEVLIGHPRYVEHRPASIEED